MMEIDIISFTDEQFAALTEEQLLEVENVQMKKNRLTEDLEEEKRKEKFRLLKAGVVRSGIWTGICDSLDASYEREVEWLRDGLLFYLRFASKPPEETSAPYEVDYSLSYEKRLEIVREYYDSTYSDPEEKFPAFKQDKVALNYLGELYAPLYELYAAQAGQ